jgi:hypothetical protein
MNVKLQTALIAALAIAVVGVYGRHLARPSGEDVRAAGQDAEVAEPSVQRALVPDAAPELAARSLSDGLFEVGQWRGKPVLVDLDGDGALDLVAAIRRWEHDRSGEGLFVWLGDGRGGWRQSIDGLRRDMGYGGSSVADANGDGRLDIAFSGHEVMSQVFLGDGAGGWRVASSGIDTVGPCADVALGDVDGNGRCELATMSFFTQNGGLRVFEVDSTGEQWTLHSELLSSEHFGAQLAFVDLDRDERLELIAATDVGPKVWHYEGGSYVDRSEGLFTTEIGGSVLAVDTRDLDGDGPLELLVAGMVLAGHPPLSIYRRGRDGWESWGSGLPADEAFFDAEFAELDGRPETVEIVAAGKNGISLIAMVEEGRFARIGRVEGTKGVVSLTTGDVNGDGRDEIVYAGFDGVQVLDVHESVDLALGGAL